MSIQEVKSRGISGELHLGLGREKLEELPKIVPWVFKMGLP